MAIVYIPSEKSEEVWTRGRVRYPWADWLDGRLWKLVHGEDYQVTPRVMGAQAHRMCKDWGIQCRTRVEGDVLWLQAKVAPPPE